MFDLDHQLLQPVLVLGDVLVVRHYGATHLHKDDIQLGKNVIPFIGCITSGFAKSRELERLFGDQPLQILN